MRKDGKLTQNMPIEIGRAVRQPGGFSAFIPHPFPPRGLFNLPQSILIKAAEADRLVGKLDGITHTLPDVDFFLHMFVTKDAESSAQIEGTRATMMDALEKGAGLSPKATDADDILFYITALEYGTKRLKSLPLSSRLIWEVHSKLMTGARASHFANPGEFRSSPNWIGGTSPGNALYVPPPVEDMHRALSDFEKFLHDEKSVLPLIHIALAHSQFETIHPFLDGNGRTGRLIITMLLCHRSLLERPVLFLSSYFKRHQKVYYSRLNGYHDGDVNAWLDFFLDGVIDTANESIEISKKIRKIRDEDMTKIQALAKRESESGVIVLSRLFREPVVTATTVMKWTKFSRAGALKLLDRFVALGILKTAQSQGQERSFIYKRYIEVF
jgi:Fic family protein